MENLPIIEMDVLNGYMSTSDNFQNVFTITDIDAVIANEDSSGEEYSSPIRLNALMMVLVLEGSANIRLDYVSYTIEKNCFAVIMPTHIFQVAEASKDFKGKLLVIDLSFIEECKPEKRSPSMNHYMQLRKNPCTVFTSEETEHMNECIQWLKEKIRLRTHSFHREVMQNAFMGYLLEVANILAGKNEALARPTLSRKEEILNQFLALLFENVKHHHMVTYYADKLFITPQYLSLILKELTGKSANKWIDEALITEAKILLKAPQVTVQQVADQLNFSDQSTFGKFFKKHMGVSPIEYRKS